MTYGEAMECLLDGMITHVKGDMVVYGNARRFYIDQRTEYMKAPEPDRVKPLGKTVFGYWLYVCPDCGLIHTIHNDVVRMKRPFDCGCRLNNKQRHTRKLFWLGKRAVEVPVKKILLDTPELDNWPC